ncbi:GLPGLI family protein [Joostella sp. CR20]|uniref:GLPGLI family protein n=1 Tax=Joostella sp. CR20 TaxID=2804312 RepID=UPI00313EDFE4
MNLKVLILSIIWLGSFQVVFSQINLKDTINYEFVYDFSYQENNVDTLSKKTSTMVLKVANNFSYYINNENMRLREMFSAYRGSNQMPVIKSRPKTRLLYVVIKDFKKGELSFSDRIGTSYYYYTQPMNQFKWKLVNEEKDILGYTCKKATMQFAGRDYIAWYATDIPISDGPYKFNGLPGLILSIYDEKKHYEFTVRSIEKVSYFFATKDEFFDHIEMSKSNFDELLERYRQKPSAMLNTGGIQFPKELLEKADRRAKERLQYENNPLELTNE